MRAPGVVEPDDSRQLPSCLFPVPETGDAVEPFDLDDAVHTLGDGVVRGLVALRHADAHSVAPEQVDIVVAAIPGASVRVMDQLRQIVSASPGDALAQGTHGVRGREALGERPSDDLAREGVRQQVQAHHAGVRVDVGDVRHPGLVRSPGSKALDGVPVLAVVVVRVRRVPPSLGRQHQSVPAQYRVEPVPSHHAAPEHVVGHEEQLVGTDARVLFPDGPHLSDYPAAMEGHPLVGPLLLVVGPSCVAKQPAQAIERYARMPFPRPFGTRFFSDPDPFLPLGNVYHQLESLVAEVGIIQ